MERYDLSGAWELREGGGDQFIKGHLPGSNYLDLMAKGKIPDPFWGQNEEAARKTAEKDYEYSRTFDLPPDFLDRENIDLVVSGLDTLATVMLNGKEIARTDNCFRTYRLPVKDALQEKDNRLTIYFENPFPYMAKQQRENPMSSANGGLGVPHIRKVQCHFGWDWGPNLPPVGIFGGIALEAWSVRIDDLIVRQDHREGLVRLSVEAALAGGAAFPADTDLETICILTAPDGKKLTAKGECKNAAFSFTLDVENPQLWWCNGLGEQYRYTLSVIVNEKKSGAELDRAEKSIGLRTITLDTTPDKWGAQFRFVVNGVPVFARGADWIPSDTFVTRTSEDDLRFYIESAHRANMNMLRVWGGGHYESDTFYELCDQYGIMVWQDFCFACASYPFGDSAFTENVHQEVIDNVKRLRHRASLALWCGNNENEILSLLWKKKKALFKSNNDFYYETLRTWVAALDGTTAYWPGSPSSNSLSIGANDLRYGDAHLWQVWHGLLPIEAFRKLPARFCSEFGLESFPSMRAVRTYTDKTEPDIKEPVMMAHQKSAGGNQKILFYLLTKYREPKKFVDMVYPIPYHTIPYHTIPYCPNWFSRGPCALPLTSGGGTWTAQAGPSTGSSTTAGQWRPGPGSITSGSIRRSTTMPGTSTNRSASPTITSRIARKFTWPTICPGPLRETWTGSSMTLAAGLSHPGRRAWKRRRHRQNIYSP
ncbi:hypothetical protein FACS1894163_08890 [Spirochaetia bacterium]|nr:hypothetical protein FACS1894163_08890 [Spirochaetia bacterium]